MIACARQHRRLFAASIVAATSAAALPGCRGDRRAAPHERVTLPATIQSAVARDEPLDAAARCRSQAARIAAWRGESIGRDRDQAVNWVSHYSEKYDACYVLMNYRAPIRHGAAPLVAELWDALDATVLAASTGDGRREIRRDFCQVNLSDDPFTSCAVAQYFVDEHMAH